MKDITPLFEALISIAAALVTVFLIPWLRTKLDEAKTEKLRTWVGVAVGAAEMLYTASGAGAEKKEYVLDFLHSKGYTADIEAIEAMIEAAVLELKVNTGTYPAAVKGGAHDE